jgi:NAD(P)-dependent dehydrogenase (short-subunit alcohol dehydrogenase family)
VLKKQLLEHKMSPENTRKSETKIAIVTGGSRGLGRNTVLSLAKRGVNSIFTYNSNQAEAEKVTGLAAEAGEKRSPCSWIPATLPLSRRRPRQNWTASTISTSRACSS